MSNAVDLEKVAQMRAMQQHAMIEMYRQIALQLFVKHHEMHGIQEGSINLAELCFRDAKIFMDVFLRKLKEQQGAVQN